MGADLYAGPLYRYCGDDWLLQHVEELDSEGISHFRFGASKTNWIQRLLLKAVSGGEEEPGEDPVPAIRAWQQQMARTSEFGSAADWNWAEQPETPYRLEHPETAGLAGLWDWAAQAEDPGLDLKSAIQQKEQAAFHQLYSANVWLPARFHGLLRDAELPADGGRVTIGSLPVLAEQLEELNRRTWRAEPRSPDPAQTAFAMFQRLTQFAAEHKIPLVLDY